jgi:hypothetical protein
MKIYKITPGEMLNPVCEKDSTSILSWLEEAESGEKIVIDIIEMTEDEYNDLPEYMGP